MRSIPTTMKKLRSNLYKAIITECMILRKPGLRDSARFAAIRSNDAVNQYLDRQTSTSTTEARAFIKNIRNGIKAGKSYYWAISFLDDATLIGTICIWNLDKEKSIAEVGYELHPDFQRRGLMREALNAVISFVFQQLSLEALIACTHEANYRSISLLEHAGFQREKVPESEMNGRAAEPEMIIYRLNNPDKKARLL